MGLSAEGRGAALVAVVVSDPVVVGAGVDEQPAMTRPTHIASDAVRAVSHIAEP